MAFDYQKKAMNPLYYLQRETMNFPLVSQRRKVGGGEGVEVWEGGGGEGGGECLGLFGDAVAARRC